MSEVTIYVMPQQIQVAGDTYPYRNTLKALGFKWSGNYWYIYPSYPSPPKERLVAKTQFVINLSTYLERAGAKIHIREGAGVYTPAEYEEVTKTILREVHK